MLILRNYKRLLNFLLTIVFQELCHGAGYFRQDLMPYLYKSCTSNRANYFRQPHNQPLLETAPHAYGKAKMGKIIAI